MLSDRLPFTTNNQKLVSLTATTAVGVFLLFFPLAMHPFVFNSFNLPKFIALRIAVLALGFAWLLRIYFENKIDFRIDLTKILWSGFILSGFVSAVFSISTHTAFFGIYPSYNGWFTYISCFFLFLFVSENITKDKVPRLIDLFLVAAAMVSVYAIAQRLGLDFGRWAGAGTRSYATWGTPIHLGGFLALSAPIALSAFITVKPRFKKIAMGIIFALILAALLFSLTRGAWIGTIIGLLVFMILIRRMLVKYRKSLLAVLMFGATMVMVAAVAWKDTPYNILKHLEFSGSSSASLTGRWHLWKSLMPLMFERPVFGFGPDTFGYISLVDDKSHNILLELIISFGWLGFGLFFIGLAVLLYRSSKDVSHIEDSALSVLSAGIVAGITALMVHFQFAWIDLGLLGLFFVFAGLLCVTQTRKQTRLYSFNMIPNMVFVVMIVLLVCSVVYVYDLSRLIKADLAYAEGMDESQNNSYAQAAISYDSAVEANPNEPYYKKYRAGAYISKIGNSIVDADEVNVIIAILKDSIQSDPWALYSYIYLIEIYLKLGSNNPENYNKADAVFAEMIELDPRTRDSVSVYMRIGQDFVLFGRTEAAQHAYKKVLELNPGNAEAVKKLAELK